MISYPHDYNFSSIWHPHLKGSERFKHCAVKASHVLTCLDMSWHFATFGQCSAVCLVGKVSQVTWDDREMTKRQSASNRLNIHKHTTSYNIIQLSKWIEDNRSMLKRLEPQRKAHNLEVKDCTGHLDSQFDAALGLQDTSSIAIYCRLFNLCSVATSWLKMEMDNLVIRSTNFTVSTPWTWSAMTAMTQRSAALWNCGPPRGLDGKTQTCPNLGRRVM